MNNPDEGATGTFWEHLDALRDCLLKALAVTVVCALVAFFFKESLFRVVLAPKEAGFVTYRLMGDIGRFLGAEGMIPDDFSVKLINTGLANQFVVHMRTALYAGVFCASPDLLYLLFRFVSPALYTHERRYAVRTVGVGYLMFLSGAALNYFLIFPLTFRFLGTYQVSAEVENTITLESYIRSDPVVGVHEDHEFAPCVVQSEISGRADAAVGDMEYADAFVLFSVTVADCARTVGRSVVDEQQLEIGHALQENASDAFIEVFLCIVDGGDD